MEQSLKPVSWIESNLKEVERESESDIEKVVIIDNMPYPEDFKLSPEEYKRIYEEKLRAEEYPPAISGDNEDATITGQRHSLGISWLNSSIDINPEQEDKPAVEIREERPAATFDLTPEEYERMKWNVEEEERMCKAMNECKEYIPHWK